MMDADFYNALVAGVERVTAWSGLLDRINVFPVPDGDTGRNLVISLAPLRGAAGDRQRAARDLLLSARGNAGNIAARFFAAFIWADAPGKIPDAVKRGRDQAWQAVSDPQPGTMLTFFDGLVEAIGPEPNAIDRVWAAEINARMVEVVRGTTARQPRLREAGVVDAGALGMFLYFDGFLHALTGCTTDLCSVASVFGDTIHLRHPLDNAAESGYCVDMVFSRHQEAEQEISALSREGESVVVLRDEDLVKIHLHTRDFDPIRSRIGAVGDILRWSVDDLGEQTTAFRRSQVSRVIHIMTDAAGSLTRVQAQTLNVTLLDSYITLGGSSLPESCLAPEILYEAMGKGTPASTSQASVFERHQFYQSALCLYEKVLYLCVGSVFTGNYATARQWKADHDPDDRLMVMDTGCAAGRLGLLATVTAGFAGQTDDPGEVAAFAKDAVGRCREYIFVDRLRYLAAGGRLSKTGAFCGDMLHMKPVISPQADGAKKVGMVRNRRDQQDFALKQLAGALQPDSPALIWLEYTDNREWVTGFGEEVKRKYPEAEIVVNPLSLTTGVHTGPGTWAIAFFADE
jgi:DegV family protein with EDD domain